MTPDVAAVADQVDPVAARTPLADSLAAEISQALQLRPRVGLTTDAESALAARLQRDRYESEDFLASR